MLVLFDIDATLLTTTRAGIHAMGDAGRDLVGPDFDEHSVDYAGRLDPLIIHDLLAAHGQDTSAPSVDRFRAAYAEQLARRLQTPGIAAACPGVAELLDALSGRELALGLLTGNFPETGELKLRASGIDPAQFIIHAWGSDSPHDPPARDHLPPVAIERFAERFGHTVDPADVTIIGDTVHDVACAKAHGCRVLAVATGTYDAQTLHSSGADRVVSDLSDTEDVLQWILTPN
jgi:phosphoglycolate phosphatase